MEETRWGRKEAIAMAAFMVLSLTPVGRSDVTTPNSMTFQECYAGCFILCAIQPTRTLSYCGFECLMDCLMPDHRNNNHNPFRFCSLGCASLHCTNISTLHNPGAMEVAGCVGSCSGVCRSNYNASLN